MYIQYSVYMMFNLLNKANDAFQQWKHINETMGTNQSSAGALIMHFKCMLYCSIIDYITCLVCFIDGNLNLLAILMTV